MEKNRIMAVGILGGVLGVVLCRWGGYYLPETDSFVSLRDLPGILLALFVGPVPALVAGALTAVGRALIGIFGGMGGTTWVGSSLATFVATLVAVAARRWIFRGGRPSFALGAAQRIAKMIDGSRIPDYCKTGRKDAHYREVQRLLDNIEAGSSITYLYVMVPDGDEIVYVWDAGEESELGEREKLDAHEGQTLSGIFNRMLKYASFVHRGEKYGYLMTAAAPTSRRLRAARRSRMTSPSSR